MAEKGDLAKGRARWEETKAWRASGGIDTILSTPHPKFDLIKSIYPHCFHMRSKEGLCVYYEKPGMIDFKRMKDLGVTIEELLQHRIFLLEYQFTYLEPDELAKAVTVIDVGGMKSLTSVGDFIKRVMEVTSKHYPDRARYIYILNVGWTFNAMWSMVSKVIDPVTRDKIHICRGNAVAAELLSTIDSDSLPAEYGGTCPVAFGDSDEEHALYGHVKRLNGQI
mmetsp:Transcript_69059/g.192971  ORF Transcript_69059/g.192971 Transcript_69059/m.192971 type:complete len:223 (-) Transcript_69059:939-1607(-)